MSELKITVQGPVGSGKSALLGEIEILCKALGVPVRYAVPSDAASEKAMTHADWTAYLEMYKPSVVLHEKGPDRTALASAPVAGEVQHPDDIAVDRFAAAMKAKLAKKRAEGRGGWDDKAQCSREWLSSLLRQHLEKGDPVDVGNLAMMLHQRGERITPYKDAPQASEAVHNAALELAAGIVGGTCWAGSPMWVSELIARHIRALKQSQADKDGCLHPRAFRSGDKQGYVCQDCGAFESDYEIHRRQQRAALSATQTEQGERDA